MGCCGLTSVPGIEVRATQGEPPSRTWWASIGLALVGLVDSVYLTWVKWEGAYDSCVGIGNCELVNQSRYAELWGQPIALWGALGYLAILILLLGERRWPIGEEFAPLVVFGMGTVGTLYSAYLTYLEVAVLEAICPYCVLSALAMTALWILSIVRLQRGFLAEG